MTNLVDSIKAHTQIMFQNADIMLKTCNLDFVLCDFPVWKHVYHMLHSCDQWFINPTIYEEPDFHEPNMNSLNVMTAKRLSRDELSIYLESVQTKIIEYIDSLTDEALYKLPQNCQTNRLSLILSQQRHFYAHLGNINATTIIETNEWPRVIGITGKSGGSSEGLFE